jgi:hypothetical protein
MTKQIAQMLALAGIGGFAAGWLAFGTGPSESRPVHRAAETADVGRSENPDPPRQEFALRPADTQADRETPAVAVDDKGRALLAWASQTGESERTLTLARSSDGGATFGPPTGWRKVPIYRYTSKSKGKDVAYSTHVLPRLVASGESIHLGWVEAIDGGPGVAYYVATSKDGGRTFSEPIRTHGAEAVKPGFTGLSVGPDGAVLCAWLDGRTKGQRPYVSTLSVDSEGLEPEQLVFEGPDGKGVCPCCDVSVVQARGGARFVAFRNSESGNRDIFVGRSGPGDPGFSTPMPVAPEHWKLDGCPHDGPSMALASDRLNVAWMDARSGKGRLYHASSPTSELDFTPRELAPGSTGTQGHPKLASTPSGGLVAVWDESLGEEPKSSGGAQAEHGHGHSPPMTGGGRAIMVATSAWGGFGTARAIAPRPGAFQLQPAIAVGPDGTALVAWNELDERGKKVVCARVVLDGPGRLTEDRPR